MRRAFILAALFAVAGCATQPKVTGNAQGGVMAWAFTNERQVFIAAQNHCATYGKDAVINQIVPEAGGSVSFVCVKR